MSNSSDYTNCTDCHDTQARGFELLIKLHNGHKVCIKELQDEEGLWKGISDRAIRKDFNTIKHFFPDGFEQIRGAKGEKGCYKAITKNILDSFMNKDTMALLVQTFNIANRTNILKSLDISETDKKILDSKIKKSKDCYMFVSNPYENIKSDTELFKKMEQAINWKRYITLTYMSRDREITYTLKPYKIIFINENFYLASENTNEKHLFTLLRVKNIKNIEVDTKTFHINFDIQEFIGKIQTPWAKYRTRFKEHLQKVEVTVDAKKASYFTAKNYLPSQKVEKENEDGSLLVSFEVTQFEEIEELIKKWIPYMRITSSEHLKWQDRVDDDLRKYLKLQG